MTSLAFWSRIAMTFDQIPPGATVFLGAACTKLVKRIQQGMLAGFVSSHVIADVVHRVMTIEAIAAKGWPKDGIAARVVAVMQANGLTHLASHDSDFDRLPGITRYAPA